MLNKSAIDLFALDATDGPPPTPPLVGFGPVIQFEQWVVPVPKNIVHNKVNQRRVNSPIIDGPMDLYGFGPIIYVNQNIGSTGVGPVLKVDQSVGILKAGAANIEINQEVILTEQGGGILIGIEQTSLSVLYGPLILIEQYTNDAAVTTHYDKFGWDCVFTLGGQLISNNAITGQIKIDRSESQASLLDITIIPSPGFISAEYYTGQIVTLDVRTAGGTKRVYTGIVDIPEIDIIQKKVTLRCTDRREELINSQLTGTSALSNVGYFSPLIFRTIVDSADELAKRLTTTPYSVDFNAFGLYTITSWYPKLSADYTLSDSDVYYDTKPEIQIGSRARITNQVNLKFQYRYERLHHTQRNYNWVSPIQQNVMNLLQWSYSMTFRDRVKTAADSAGWPLKGNITYVPIWPSGWYNGIAWSTVHITGTSSILTDGSGKPLLNPDGSPVTIGGVPQFDGTGLPILDSNKNEISVVTFSGGTDYGPLYCMGASWIATYRWSQTVTEEFDLTITAPQSVAQYQLIQSDLSYSTTDTFNSSVWDSYKTYSTPPTDMTIVGDPNGTYYINADTSRLDVNNALYTAISQARNTILSSHRDTKVNATRFIWPEIDLIHTLNINTTQIQAIGKVFAIEHVLNVETGEATSKVTISLFKAQGTTTDSGISIPVIPDDTVVTDSSVILLGNHFGFDPTLPAATSWNGMIGNRIFPSSDGGTTARTTFSEQFRVDTPAIDESLRQERLVYNSTTFNVLIPDDELTIVF